MKKTQLLTLSAMFLALGLVLPFLTGQIPQFGSMLLPMHLPVLLCGFVCGPWWGLAVGAITPILRSAAFGMPPMLPNAVAMMCELMAYGAMAGFFYKLLPQKIGFTYVALLIALVIGRDVWGFAAWGINAAMGNAFTWEVFAAGAVLTAWPGIILQFVLIPPIVLLLRRGGFTDERPMRRQSRQPDAQARP